MITYDETHKDCLFVQRYGRAEVRPQVITRDSANRGALEHGWNAHLIQHIHRAVLGETMNAREETP